MEFDYLLMGEGFMGTLSAMKLQRNVNIEEILTNDEELEGKDHCEGAEGAVL